MMTTPSSLYNATALLKVEHLIAIHDSCQLEYKNVLHAVGVASQRVHKIIPGGGLLLS